MKYHLHQFFHKDNYPNTRYCQMFGIKCQSKDKLDYLFLLSTYQRKNTGEIQNPWQDLTIPIQPGKNNQLHEKNTDVNNNEHYNFRKPKNRLFNLQMYVFNGCYPLHVFIVLIICMICITDNIKTEKNKYLFQIEKL